MKNFTKLVCLFVLLLACETMTAQTTRVKITVDWEDLSYENRVIVEDPGFNPILTIENPNEPYQTTGTDLIYTATYDLGCVQHGTYRILLYNANNVPWTSGFVSVLVDDLEVINNNGSSAGTTADIISFVVEDKNGTDECTPLPDFDGDGVIDAIDLDDDNDGILDSEEALGINIYNCQIPALVFNGGGYDAAASGGNAAGTQGAVYRFPNAIANEPYDVLVEITEIRNATLSNIDDDLVDNPDYLQTEITFTGNETPADCVGCDYPGITFRFTIVDNDPSTTADDNNTTPTSTLFRIGGTTWDVDGAPERKESVRYYNPSAYGVDNPTTVSVTDVNGDGSEIEMTAGGNLEGPGFSTLPQLRSYFQFRLDATDVPINNDYFELRMQNVRTTYTASSLRQYSMSFTQCDVLDFKSATIIIQNGDDEDGDGVENHQDIDSDNDGIPDNIEFQPTSGYIAPQYSGTPYVNIDPVTGVDTAYTAGITIVDTDGDDIPDFLDTDSDNDGILDIEENGSTFNIASGSDSDSDGLDNNFDDVSGTDVNDEINTGTIAELTTSFLDSDGDLGIDVDGIPGPDGDLDYRDAIDVYFESATVDFDGDNDYVDSENILSGLQDVTMMAWIKPDSFTDNDRFVIGQDNFKMFLNTSGILNAKANGNTLPTTNAIDLDKWSHVTAVYQNGTISVYVNGELEATTTIGVFGLAAATDKFTIGKNSSAPANYFDGAIDEVRVFDLALTQDQIQQMVFQEIEQNSTNVRGKIIPKDIQNFSDNSPVAWGKLQAYYPMTQIATGRTLDFSGNDRHAILHNITTIQPQTAPMPYETVVDGNWEDTSSWLHGDVWDIDSPLDVKPWSIFSIKNDITNNSGVRSYGLIIDDGATLTINGDNAGADYEVNNGWYLELNGTLDLLGDSQLVQTMNSDLVTDADGKILRRQEGNSNYYWYNYWSSPVGATQATSNSNTNFNLDMIVDGNENDILFTDSYNELGRISRSWLYTFQNGQTYYDWQQITELSDIAPGVGYTQKGTQSTDGEQNYIFVGKPHNGTILLTADDVDGDDGANEHLNEPGSYNFTSTLIGNPYPSALDAEKFILDNRPDPVDGTEVIGGSIYVWEQWDGDSHILNEYQGGYGTINRGSVAPSYQWNDPGLDVSGLAKTPTPFIPVGQGFFVEVIADLGTIEFNNSQRVFKKEADNESVFFRSSESQSTTATNGEDPFGLIRLELTVSNGNKRNFVLLFGDTTTDGYDYGYDARTIDPQDDDLNSYLNGEKMIIQSYAPITDEKVIDLVFNSSGTYNYSLEIIEIENIPEDQEIYLKDNLTNTYFDLKNGAYSFSSEVNGEDTERFDIVFNSGSTLSNEDFTLTNTMIFINSTEDVLYVKGLETNAKFLTISNMIGQQIKAYGNLDSDTLENGLDVSDLSSGVYIVKVINEFNQSIDKKVIID